MLKKFFILFSVLNFKDTYTLDGWFLAEIVDFKDESVPQGFYAADVAPDNSLLASIQNYASDRVEIWDLHRGTLKQILQENLGRPNTCLRFNAKSDAQIAIGDDLGGVAVWDASSGVKLKSYKEDQGLVKSLGFDHDMLAALYKNTGNIVIWDTKTGNKIKQFPPLKPSSPVCLNFSPDGMKLACGMFTFESNRDEVAIWDIKNAQPIRNISTCVENAAVDWNKKGDEISVACGIGGAGMLFDPSTGSTKQIYFIGGFCLPITTDYGSTGNYVAFGTDTYPYVYICDTQTGKHTTLSEATKYRATVHHLRFIDDNNVEAVTSLAQLYRWTRSTDRQKNKPDVSNTREYLRKLMAALCCNRAEE